MSAAIVGRVAVSRVSAAARASRPRWPPEKHERLGGVAVAAARGAEPKAERVGTVAEHAAGSGSGNAGPGGDERLVERVGGRVAVLRGRSGRSRDGVVEPVGNGRSHGARMVVSGGVAVRQLTGESEVKRQAQRIQIGPRIAPPARQQFRRRIVRRAGERTRRGDSELAVEPCGAEVGQAVSPVGIEQDVLRFDVAVKDAMPVGSCERGRDIAAEPDRLFGGKRASIPDLHLEVGAGDVLHEDEAPGPFLDEVVYRHDVLVRQSPHRLHLTAHPFPGDFRRRGWRHEQLERHVPAELAIAGEIDHRIAAAAQLAADLPPVAEHGARSEIRSAHWAVMRPRTSSALERQPSWGE